MRELKRLSYSREWFEDWKCRQEAGGLTVMLIGRGDEKCVFGPISRKNKIKSNKLP